MEVHGRWLWEGEEEENKGGVRHGIYTLDGSMAFCGYWFRKQASVRRPGVQDYMYTWWEVAAPARRRFAVRIVTIELLRLIPQSRSFHS